MDITEAVRKRKSIRAFSPRKVPRETLRKILKLALRAPSGGNTQPWEFAIAGSGKLEEIRASLIQQVAQKPVPDFPLPGELPARYNERRRAVSKKVFDAQGIAGNDRTEKDAWRIMGIMMFDAPCVIYICLDRALLCQPDNISVWPVFDCGLVAGNIMLLATAQGLGTIPLLEAAFYPDVLRKALKLPESKLILLGIAIGYPDENSPVNSIHSERDSLVNVSTWHGFD
jgi:nitroreductase